MVCCRYRARLSLFTVWNTAVRNKTFLDLLRSLTSVARTPETKWIVVVAVVIVERNRHGALVHI